VPLPTPSDRERVEAILRMSYTEGRIDVDELSERLDRAGAARSLAELEGAVGGLPVPVARGGRPAERGFGGGQVAGAFALTILAPFGRLIVLVDALSMLRSEQSTLRRTQLRTWALAASVLLLMEVVLVVVFVAR